MGSTPIVLLIKNLKGIEDASLHSFLFISRYPFDGIFVTDNFVDRAEEFEQIELHISKLKKNHERVAVVELVLSNSVQFDGSIYIPPKSKNIYRFSHFAERSFLVGDLLNCPVLKSIPDISLSAKFDKPDEGVFFVNVSLNRDLFDENEIGVDMGNRSQSALMMLLNSVRNSMKDVELFELLCDNRGEPILNPKFNHSN